MFEQVALFRREESSAQKPRGSRELKKESARLPNLGLQGPVLHHAKTPRPGTSIQISTHSLCRSLCLFSPMQDLGSHCVPSPLSPNRAEERMRCDKMQCSFLSAIPEQEILGQEEAEGLLLSGELHWDWPLCSSTLSP